MNVGNHHQWLINTLPNVFKLRNYNIWIPLTQPKLINFSITVSATTIYMPLRMMQQEFTVSSNKVNYIP